MSYCLFSLITGLLHISMDSVVTTSKSEEHQPRSTICVIPQSTCAVGFDLNDIAVLKGYNDVHTIDLCVKVNKDCTHLKNYSNSQLCGPALDSSLEVECM
jgi:hypothetical protein